MREMRRWEARQEMVREDPWMERIAWIMDESIRLGPWSIGLDGIIGLIPGVGDMAGTIVSTLLIARAVHQGVSRVAVIRMLANVGIDALVGSIPLIGDLFDFAYKANVRNLEIYRQSIRGERSRAADWAFLVVVLIVLLFILAIPVIGLIYFVELFRRG